MSIHGSNRVRILIATIVSRHLRLPLTIFMTQATRGGRKQTTKVNLIGTQAKQHGHPMQAENTNTVNSIGRWTSNQRLRPLATMSIGRHNLADAWNALQLDRGIAAQTRNTSASRRTRWFRNTKCRLCKSLAPIKSTQKNEIPHRAPARSSGC